MDIASLRTPDWLPANWTVESRKRSRGASAGVVDKYYVDPSGRKFRSKKDVYHFLETGSIRKKKLIETPVAYVTMEELAAPESNQIPSSDPLLKSDAFIDATVNGDGDAFSRDQTVLDPEPLARRSPIEAEPVSVVKVTGDIEEVTPVASSKNSTFPEASQRCSELSLVNESSVRPDWLPPDWRTEYRVRSTGATAGHTDKYYVDPAGHLFRSKNEVLHFLETGSIRKRKIPANINDAAKALENSGGRKGKKSLSNNKKDKSGLKKSKSKTASKFDFTNVPPKVDWVLTDSSKGSWTPFINEHKVPESDKRVWTAAFAAEDNGGPMS